MSNNIGKIFEAQIAKSMPDYVLLYRLPDSAQSFGNCKNLRFSNKSPFDFLLWNSREHVLYALELKTVKGKSISFEKNKNEKGEIHYHQIQGLNKWNKFDGIVCGFIIEFREIEVTIFISIDTFNELIKKINKKSFNYTDVINSNLPYSIIPQERKRTRYIYDIEGLFHR